MKKLLAVLAFLLVITIPAYAQMGGMMENQKGETKQLGMMMDESMMSMMQHMMGQGMMMRDITQMMTDMMKMQKKMITGVNAAEKEEMMSDMDKMMDRMEKMMSDMRGMMMKGMMGTSSENGVTKEAPKGDEHKH
jgi:predicted site-specific integrase-resolvase